MIEIKKFTFSNTILMQKAHKIRHDVFVIGQNCPKELEYENEEDSIHFILFKKKMACATARYRFTKLGVKLERFAVINSERGKNLGKKILLYILNDLKKNKDKKYLHAQIQVVPFYEKFGFKANGEIFEEAGIKHKKMNLISF